MSPHHRIELTGRLYVVHVNLGEACERTCTGGACASPYTSPLTGTVEV